MYIGYNVNKINAVMDDVSSACVSFSSKVGSSFEAVKSVMRREWVGPDQQDFEEELIKRLNKLLENTKALANNTSDNLYNLGVAWADFQDKNTLDGKSTGMGKQLKNALKKPGKFNLEPIMFAKIGFTAGQSMGLANASSIATVQSTLETFVSDIKRESKMLFDQIDVQNAFYGEAQKNAIKGYLEKVGEAIGVIESSISDFNQAMVKLTSGAYGTADTDVSGELSKLNSSIEESLDSYKDTRWN